MRHAMIEVRTSREDAGPSLFLQNELEAVISETYRTDLPQLRMLSMIPVRDDIDPRAANISYSQLTQVGSAAVLRVPSSEIPRVDLYREKFTSPVRSIATVYGWTVDELDAADLAQIPLEREMADAARRVIAERVSDIIINGHPQSGLPGLMANPNIPRATVANGVGGSPLWSLKTADEIIRDMTAQASSIVSISRGTYAPDTMLLPIDQFNRASDLPRAAFSDESALSYFKRTNNYIKNVEWVPELRGVGTGGVDVSLAFMNSPSVFSYWMVQAFQQYPNQMHNMRLDVICREKSGGVTVVKPLGLSIYEGI